MEKLAPPEAGLVHNPEFLVTQGDPAQRIIELAGQEHADVIVLGVSGEQRTSTHFRRGVAYKVISSAPCAVLTAR